MSIVVKARQGKGKHKPVSATALWVVLGLAVVFFLVRYGQELLLEHELEGKAQIQSQANAALRDDNARLKASLEYFTSDKYIEQRAREDLNLRRNDEQILIPISITPPEAAPQLPVQPQVESIPPAEAPQQETPNWQKWFGLFSPTSGSP